MNQSFIACILFALLAIGGSLLANLTVLVFTASQWHVTGVVLALIAAGSSYWAQHYYTIGATIHAADAMGLERTEHLGLVFQLIAIACIAGSVACFWLGMR